MLPQSDSTATGVLYRFYYFVFFKMLTFIKRFEILFLFCCVGRNKLFLKKNLIKLSDHLNTYLVHFLSE